MSDLSITFNQLANLEGKSPPRKVRLPVLNEVLYTPPNPDGSRKACGNCYQWTRDHKCLTVHGTIAPDMVCGYHVFGLPQNEWVDLGQSQVDAHQAGLYRHEAGQGTSCDNCKWSSFDKPPHGMCAAVTDGGSYPAMIEARGCCARWEDKDGNQDGAPIAEPSPGF